MEVDLILYACLAISTIFLIHTKFSNSRRHKLPPSPAAALPIVGHLHLLKHPLHRTFQRFSQISGPIFFLKLGVRRCVVLSSPEVVEECFTKHDIILSNRPDRLFGQYLCYNHGDIISANYGDHWRSLRRIATMELLSPARLNNLLHIRRDEVDRLISSLYNESKEGFSKVELRPKLLELAFNVMTRMVAGKTYLNGDQKEGRMSFSKLIHKIFEMGQASNPQDFLPFLQWIDYGGLKKKMASLFKEMDEFFQEVIEEHREEKRNTMIGHLLSLGESKPSDRTIKALMMDMLLAGTDTSSVTIEWAMSLLLNNPSVLENARAEVENKVGNHRLINEDDLPNLPYLRNIILETLRLFPPGPLIIHAPSEDFKVREYDIPSGTTVLISAWAIHRDPKVWVDPTSFKPERFEGKEVDPYKWMPFGMGRRACPGGGLAHRVMGLGLGSLIQCFDWERASLKEVDLAEGRGLTMPKLEPLEAMCRSREIMKT